MDYARRGLEAAFAAMGKTLPEWPVAVSASGGKFYFAKDAVIGRQDMLRMFPPDKLEGFLAQKRALDPDGLFQTDLYRRVFGGAHQS